MTPKPPDLALLERLLAEAHDVGNWRTYESRNGHHVMFTFPDGMVRGGWPESDAALVVALVNAAPALVAGNRRADELAEALAVAYAERNLVAQLAAALGTPDYPAWWGVDPAESDWPVLYIDLGTAYGQVSWHMPRAEVLDGGLPETGPEWDGHSTETKDDRIRRFVIPGAAQPSAQHSEGRNG